ncbi:hypothetical protein L1887_13844 [Cichorium endivia]|nr:hypothetical protein L1887_13844 [Cichorium endivia]
MHFAFFLYWNIFFVFAYPLPPCFSAHIPIFSNKKFEVCPLVAISHHYRALVPDSGSVASAVAFPSSVSRFSLVKPNKALKQK